MTMTGSVSTMGSASDSSSSSSSSSTGVRDTKGVGELVIATYNLENFAGDPTKAKVLARHLMRSAGAPDIVVV